MKSKWRKDKIEQVTLKPVVFKRDPPYTALLIDPKVDNAVCGTLYKMGRPKQDLGDGLQEVRLRAIQAFSNGMTPPATVDEMKSFCARIAKNYVFDLRRKRATARKCGDTGLCDDPDEFLAPEPTRHRRDPVDAGRQLHVAAELFRQRKMPEHGVDILEGVASNCSYQEVADDLHIPSFTVQSRLKTMRRRFAEQLAAQGMVDEGAAES